jgi:tRNA-intron endonuclease, archaea type
MSENKPAPAEFYATGILVKDGVRVTEQSSIDALSNRGYGLQEDKTFTLAFYEALYLSGKGILKVKNAQGEEADFQSLLHSYEAQDKDAWVNYMVYRDLRSRGYVVREGFGNAISFRIYDRGTYGKDTAPYLVLSVQEGKPLPIKDLSGALQQCQSQKKELILAVTNRRGEIVFYSVGEMHLPVEEES